eukprot:4728941-Alexandrium_andersonii.AAC.1
MSSRASGLLCIAAAPCSGPSGIPSARHVRACSGRDGPRQHAQQRWARAECVPMANGALVVLGANGVQRSSLQLAPETEHSPWVKALVAREKE